MTPIRYRYSRVFRHHSIHILSQFWIQFNNIGIVFGWGYRDKKCPGIIYKAKEFEIGFKPLTFWQLYPSVKVIYDKRR